MAQVVSSQRRTIDRLRALVGSQLSPQQVIREQVRVIGEAMHANAVPDFYTLRDLTVPMQAFEVWCGTETITEEIRGALAAGYWPGPADMPPPTELLSGTRKARFVTMTLWGNATPPMPWEEFWRSRNVRHGLYGVFVSRKGRIGIMLASRGNEEMPFEAGHLAFARACAPYVEAALDLPVPDPGRGFSPADSVQLRFAADGSIAAMSFGGPELLRDLAGGGAGASAAGRRIVERANLTQIGVPQLDEASRAALTLAGTPDERSFRSSMFDLALRPVQDPDRQSTSMVIAENGYGRFQLRISTLVGQDGAMERLGLITRSVPPLLLRLRGALAVQASAREIQLLCALEGDTTVKDAAKTLNIAASTTRTLTERLAARVGASGMAQASDRLMEIGRAADRSDQ